MQTALAKDVKFLLKDLRSTDTTLISLVYRYDNCRFVYSTGQFIEPYQWDAPDQRAHTSQKARPVRQDHETINAHLDDTGPRSFVCWRLFSWPGQQSTTRC